MKTSLRRASKRTLALLLGVLMLITSIGFGTIITADAATYYLHYSTNSEPNNYSNHVSMSEGSNGYYYCSFNATQANINYYFSINNSSNSGTTTLFGSNYDDYSVDSGTGVSNAYKSYFGGIRVVQFQVNNTGIVYVGYNPSTKNVKISTNASEVGGTGGSGGGGGATDPSTEPTPTPTPTNPSGTNYTVGVATNDTNATATVTATGLTTITNNTTTLKTGTVKEYTQVTFSTTNSDKSKEFKGWFTTINPLTSHTNTSTGEKGYNAVSMDETFSMTIRSNVQIYALYSDSQDEKNGGVVSGAVFYYSAPVVSLDIKGRNDTTIEKASLGEQITLEATITKESDFYKNRFKQSGQSLQYLYNFYEKEKNGKNHLIDSQTGNAATKAVTDQRLTCTTTTTFSEDTTYFVEAYCVYVNPEDNPFSVGVSEEKTIKSDTEINTEKVKVYIDFDKYNVSDASSAKIVVTDANDIGKSYNLTKLESSNSSNIYQADVDVTYTTRNNINNMKSDFVSINVDNQVISIDDADQPEISSLLEHKILWYKTNTNSLKTNVTQKYYTITNTQKYTKSINYRPYTYRTQSNELSTKRIYLTDNRDDKTVNDKCWATDGVNVVYTLNKTINMGTSGYSNNHTNYIWFQEKMINPDGENAQGQKVLYVDLPYNVTGFYFENAKSGEKAEVHYLSDDLSKKNEANAFYFDAKNTVRIWPDNDYPETPAVAKYISDLYIVKGETLDITATLAEERDHSVSKFSASYVSNGTSVATVSTVSGKCTLTAKGEGTTTVTIKTSGEVTGVKMNGISRTINVTVIDKDELKNMIAEAEYIIDKRNHDDENFRQYSANSIAAFESVYSSAIDVCNRSLYSQEEIKIYTDLLREAIENIHSEVQEGEYKNYFDLVAYNSSNVKVISDGNGTVTEPSIKSYTHKVTGAYGDEVGVDNATITPNISKVENGYEILYAEGYGFSSTAQETEGEFAADFVSWTIDGDDNVSNTKTLDVETAKPASTTYIAKFGKARYTLNLIYQFKDFDTKKAGTNEYTEEGISDTFSTYKLETSITLEEAAEAKQALDSGNVSGTKVTELSKECTPDVVSSYYTYSYPKEIQIGENYQLSFAEDDSKTAELTITLDQKQRNYKISVNGKAVGTDYHYQEQVVLNAEDHLTGPFSENQKFKWVLVDKNEMGVSTVAEEGSENILSLQKNFTVRALEDGMSYRVSLATDDDTIDKTSVISPAYTEIIYNKENEKRIQQNFYIQDNLENSGDLQAAGNIFYYWNKKTEQPVDRNLRHFMNETGINKTSLTDLIKANYETWERNAQANSNYKDTGTIMDLTKGADEQNTGLTYTYYYKPEDQGLADGLLRYSSANQCWSYIFAVNSADNYEKYKNFSYRVHSFFILKDGTGDERVIVSNTYAQADVYVDTTDYENRG